MRDNEKQLKFGDKAVKLFGRGIKGPSMACLAFGQFKLVNNLSWNVLLTIKSLVYYYKKLFAEKKLWIRSFVDSVFWNKVSYFGGRGMLITHELILRISFAIKKYSWTLEKGLLVFCLLSFIYSQCICKCIRVIDPQSSGNIHLDICLVGFWIWVSKE